MIAMNLLADISLSELELSSPAGPRPVQTVLSQPKPKPKQNLPVFSDTEPVLLSNH